MRDRGVNIHDLKNKRHLKEDDCIFYLISKYYFIELLFTYTLFVRILFIKTNWNNLME